MRPAVALCLGVGGALAALALAAAAPGGRAQPTPSPMGDAMPLPSSVGIGAERAWPLRVKLAAASPALRLPELLAALAAQGHQPSVVYTWRTLIPTQDALVARGVSRSRFSFHNAVDASGQAAALAADLCDARFGWGDNNPASDKTQRAAAFFLALGAHAEGLGLTWGGRWSKSSSFWTPWGMGWDPAHVQALPNTALPSVRRASLLASWGPGRLVAGSGGYLYRQWPNGVLEIAKAPSGRPGDLVLPEADARAWTAITQEIGVFPGGRHV